MSGDANREPVTDRELVSRICDGKNVLADFLVQEMGGQVAKLSRDFGHDALLADLFVHLAEDDFKRLRSFRFDSSLKTWVWSVARRLAIDLCRQNIRRQAQDYAVLERLMELAEEAVVVPREVDNTPDCLALIEVIKQLPEQQRTVLQLYLAGLSTGEIAQRLGTTPQAVHVAKSRALKTLRDLMNPGGENG
jgi:RNA polymerase sigma-70 factor, ECF subfamily